MNRSVLLAGALCIPVVYALVQGDFVVILMSVVAGYVIQTLLWRAKVSSEAGSLLEMVTQAVGALRKVITGN